jgi:hypothetical protein
MKRYVIYGKVKNTIYSVVNRGLEEAKESAQRLKKIIKGEDFYVIETLGSTPSVIAAENVEEFLKGAIHIQ